MKDLKPIRTRRDYEQAMAEVERLWGAKSGTPDGDRLDVLATLWTVEEALISPGGVARRAAIDEEGDLGSGSSRRRGTRLKAAPCLALTLGLLCSACDLDSFSETPVTAVCSEIGRQCQLPGGPLGVCQETPCGPGAKRPCFKCVSQH